MTVASILAEKGRNVLTARPDTLVSDIVDTLAANKVGAMVLTDDRGAVAGIVSERDIVREIANRGAAVLDQPASACMTSKVVSCSEANTVDQVMNVMTVNRFRHLPVVEDGRLVGIISIGDVVKRKIEQVEQDAEQMRNYIATG